MRLVPEELRARLDEMGRSRRRKALGVGAEDVVIGEQVRITEPELVQLGPGVELRDFVRIRGMVSIGADSSIRDFCFLDARQGSITIGSSCSVNDYCVLYGHGGITIGDDVRMATHTVVVAADHRFDDDTLPMRVQGVEPRPVVVGDDVLVGANVCILGGVEIGTGSVIGAGAVVVADIPPMSVAAGNPARVVSRR